ncbi:MAG TPA: hypothetical protein DD473_00205 [Planctomycetaceae bacterium]|nr:hypothetical protein [Planctomycetaceae bacterium]
MLSREMHHDRFWTSPVAFVGSLCVHALLALLIVSNLNSCGRTGDFGTTEVYREVGITYDSPAEETSEESTEVTEQKPEKTELPVLPQSLSDVPQAEMTPLPEIPANALIGPGPAESLLPSSSEMAAISQQLPPPTDTKSGIPSTTKFFDIATRGRVLIYVIDCSGSMNRNNSFRHAKAELSASLERLDGSHKFHIIFYNDHVYEFLDRNGKPDVQWATAGNLARGRSFISEMDNSEGTAHLPALIKALSYSPEVIFFLTDAAEPAMTAKQLDEVRRVNKGQAAIHCIEFGIQPTDLKLPNFLQKLSSENGGTYRYRDTNEFR